MKKFKFTLETVHKVRELRQEKEELVLSEIQSEVNKATSRLSEIEQKRLDAVESYSQKLKKGEAINPFELELSTRHIESLQTSIREAKANVTEKQNERKLQSFVVAAANQQVKITEKLHENQKKKHKTEIDRHEQSAIDELVSANYARRMVTTR
jgi:flagellar protein FliJ